MRSSIGATTPSLIPRGDDLDTGFGWAGANEPNIIAGGIEMMRCINDGTTTTRYNVLYYPAYIKEQTAASADITNYGQIWVNSTNSHLYFTNDTGTDYQVTGLGGITGSGSNDRVAVWSGPSSLDSSANLTFNGTTLAVTGNITLGGNSVLTTATNFGGDVSGTYNNIQVTNDSHTHDVDNLTGVTAHATSWVRTGGSYRFQNIHSQP